MTAPATELAGPPARPDRRALLVATVVVLCLLAAVLGVIGSFLSLAMPHVLGVPVPVGVLIGVGGNLAVGLLGAHAAHSRVVPVCTALVWLAVVLLFSLQGPGGDGILTSSGRSAAFLLLGTMAAALGIGVVPARALRRGPGGPSSGTLHRR